MSDLRTATRRMLVALDHYWDAYEIDEDRMLLWWNAYERERAKVDALLAESNWCYRP